MLSVWSDLLEQLSEAGERRQLQLSDSLLIALSSVGGSAVS
jgi:hypothetical protein